MNNGTKTSTKLSFRLWLCFMVFICVVVSLIWLFQISAFDKFYERIKIADIRTISNRLIESFHEDEDWAYFSESAVKNDFCVLFFNRYGRILYSDDYIMGENCVIHSPNSVYTQAELIRRVDAAGENGLYKIDIEPRTGQSILLFGIKVDDAGYLFLNTQISPPSSVSNILRQQLLLITDILIIFVSLISFVFSKIIAAPITRITKSAQHLAKGEYTVDFNGGSFYEAQKLADTLNYAAKEISKIDTQQRDLIANVSHDLRTPLTMLKAYAEKIRDLSGENPEKREQDLKIIINETDRLAALVNDMLNLSKIENGANELVLTEFEISSVMREITERFNGLSNDTALETELNHSTANITNGVTVNFKSGGERIVSCDKGKIEQVVYNLISNAANYTGPDKKVSVNQINFHDGVLIEVSDSGKGIPPEDIALIFEKYYRSENHKRTTVGTGLGLSIVRAILKKHGFSFGVKSTVGEGSTFWFFISDNNISLV